MLEATPQPSDGSASFCVSEQPAGQDRRSDPQVRLSARGLSVGYRTGRDKERVIARDLDLDLRASEFVCLLGPNGAGKSTLLRTLAGLQEPLAGRVEVDGRSFDEWRPRELARRLAVVLTDRALPGAMTGFDLVRLGRHPHTPWTGALSDGDRSAIRSSLEAVDASHLASRPLSEMSDGERQKVTIARALAQEADVLVLDEVTAFLDLPRRVEIVRLLRRLAHGNDSGRPGEAPKAIVLATHDLDLALRSADRLWLVPPSDEGPGELRQGIPESLVLDGSFERVFASEGVDFDRRSGSFRLHRRHRGVAWVSGDGLAAEWTRRALDRLGFELDDQATLRVEVMEGEAGPSWRVQSPVQPDPAKATTETSNQTYARLDDALAVLAGASSG